MMSLLATFNQMSGPMKGMAALFIVALIGATMQLVFVKKNYALEWYRDIAYFGVALFAGADVCWHSKWLPERTSVSLIIVALLMTCARHVLTTKCKSLQPAASQSAASDVDTWPPAPRSQ